MTHCWTDRYEASGCTSPTDAEIKEIDRRWPNGIPEGQQSQDPWEHYAQVRAYLGETCMLEDGHDGPHQFEDISNILITFPEASS